MQRHRTLARAVCADGPDVVGWIGAQREDEMPELPRDILVDEQDAHDSMGRC
ncbi:MAG: hypothetical protein ACJ8GJ_15300 [Vitreoscilla sp.]